MNGCNDKDQEYGATQINIWLQIQSCWWTLKKTFTITNISNTSWQLSCIYVNCIIWRAILWQIFDLWLKLNSTICCGVCNNAISLTLHDFLVILHPKCLKRNNLAQSDIIGQ